jgi:hypothetical protein
MRASIVLFFFFTSMNLHGQKGISFPFLNRDELGPCPVCDITDSTDIAYLERFERILDDKFGFLDEDQELYLRKIEFVESILNRPSLTTAVRVKLLNTVIDWYCIDVVDNYDDLSEVDYEDSTYTVYNNALASAIELVNFSGPLKIIELYDEILALPLDDISLRYYKNLKLAYCAQSRIIKLVNDWDNDWIENKTLPQNLLGDEREVAQNFLNTMNETDFNPFVVYKAISPGINTSFGKELWYGFQLAYEPFVEIYNPLLVRHPFLGYRTDYRTSYFGIKLLVNPDLTKKDFLFTPMDYQLTDFIYLNPFQFGWHLYGKNNNKMFVRPEFGIHYSIFTLSYSYNMTLDEEIRPFTEKHMVNFKISYPLFKIGSFY